MFHVRDGYTSKTLEFSVCAKMKRDAKFSRRYYLYRSGDKRTGGEKEVFHEFLEAPFLWGARARTALSAPQETRADFFCDPLRSFNPSSRASSSCAGICKRGRENAESFAPFSCALLFRCQPAWFRYKSRARAEDIYEAVRYISAVSIGYDAFDRVGPKLSYIHWMVFFFCNSIMYITKCSAVFLSETGRTTASTFFSNTCFWLMQMTGKTIFSQVLYDLYIILKFI